MNSKKIEFISSRQNSKVKLMNSLHLRKNRQKEKRFLIEGIKIVSDVFRIKGTSAFDFIFYSDDMGENKELRELANNISLAGIETYETSDEIMSLITDTKTPQGIVGVMLLDYLESEMHEKIHEAIKVDSCKLLVLDKVQDPGNLGTIIRTADASGFDGVILTKGTVDLLNSKVLRSTMGSIYNIPIINNVDNYYIESLKDNEFSIISAALSGAVDYRNVDYSGKIIIVIGNEGNGISDEILEISDLKVKIPIFGKAESLNASVAAGILIYKTIEFKY